MTKLLLSSLSDTCACITFSWWKIGWMLTSNYELDVFSFIPPDPDTVLHHITSILFQENLSNLPIAFYAYALCLVQNLVFSLLKKSPFLQVRHNLAHLPHLSQRIVQWWSNAVLIVPFACLNACLGFPASVGKPNCLAWYSRSFRIQPCPHIWPHHPLYYSLTYAPDAYLNLS